MKKNYILFLITLLGYLTLEAQTIFTNWNFDDQTNNPTIGTGTITLIGGVAMSTTSPYPGGNPSTGKGMNTTTYPAQSTAPGTAGVEFAVSTVGKSEIGITFDHRSSGTMSRWAQFEYSIDGGANWVVAGNNAGGLSPHDTFFSFSLDLTACTSCENNANFKFRIVSIFSPDAFNENTTNSFAANTAYMRSNADAKYTPTAGLGTGTYGSAGTWRFDNVSFVEGFVMGTDDLEHNNAFQMYPNPSTSMVYFNEMMSISVFDLTGKKVLSKENVNSIDIAELVSGIYFIQSEGGFTQKLIKE